MNALALLPVLLMAAVVSVSGCTADSGPPAAPPGDGNLGTDGSSQGGPDGQTGQVKEFSLTASSWEFQPSVITVSQGDTVKLTITASDDGIGSGHGFSLPAFGVSETLPEGEPVTVEFVADKKGSFPFVCSVFCGQGHGGMKGTLVVE